MGCGPESEQRGISHLVGAVLLIGITMTAVVLILVTGTGTIGDVNEDSNGEIAGQTLQQADEVFNRGENGSLDIPRSIQGEVEVQESSWRLKLNGNPDCSSGPRDMGALRYDGEDQTVGYEGGGVWKMTESGATMDSPPAMTYQDGSLSMQFPNITGDVTNSNQIEATANTSQQHIQNSKLSKGLYTNRTYNESGPYTIECAPDELDNATLSINESEYASAWARYFESNYDDRRVDVTTSKPISSGDNITVEFQLGDVSDPEFVISDLDVSRSDQNDPMNVTANVTNTGGLAGEQDVRFDYNDSGGATGSDVKRGVVLASGETTTVSFNVSDANISRGTYDLTVSTENDDRDVEIKFASAAGIPDPSINPDVPQNANIEQNVTVNVTVGNTRTGHNGAMSAYEDVEFQYREAGESDWKSVGTKTVTVGPDKMENATFALPTTDRGLYDWRARIDGDNETGQYAVGSSPYFSINETNWSPPRAHQEFELDVAVENIGDHRGEKDVDVTIEEQKPSGQWSEVSSASETSSMALNGSVYESAAPGSNEEVLQYRHTFTNEGKYRYTVNTTDETTVETFHVGSPEGPLLLVDSVDVSQNPTGFDNTVWFNVTVENTGTAQAHQTVEVRSEDGGVVASERVLVNVDEKETMRQRAQITDTRFDAGPNSLDVTTDNSSEPETLVVLENGSIEDGDGGVTVNREVDAEIRVLGTELEASGGRYWDSYIIHDPVEMWLDVENDTHSESVDLWPGRNDGDLNHPNAEKAMIDNPGAFSYNRSFGAGSKISVFARSYTCAGYYDTGVTFDNVMPGGYDATGYGCGNWADERITISHTDNSENVVILGDDDEVPAYGAAEAYQRDLDQILGHRIDDDGTLSLGDDERVFLYELSERNAEPEYADGTGDPDYNDAVALFRVVDVQRNVQTPPNFVIEDVSAPDQVERNEDAQVTVTVNNTGGTAGETSVFFDLDGHTVQEGQTETLETGETDTVTIDVPTDADPGTYPYTVLLGSNPQESRSGAITIGEVEGRNVQITSFSAPGISEIGDSPMAEIEVTNSGTGDADGAKVKVVNITSPSRDTTNVTEVTLEPGDSTTYQVPIPTGSGEVQYEVRTEDTEDPPAQRIYYGTSDVRIANMAIGTSTYTSPDTLAEEASADKMHFKLENHGDIGGARDVTLEINGRTYTDDIQIGSGRLHSTRPEWLTFDVGLADGYYEYTLTVEDDDGSGPTWEGELFVSPDADSSTGLNSSSPISVDSNQVVIGG